MNKLKLFNTLSRKKEEFKPINKKAISIYSCGPTVYNFAHIGNLRAYVFADLLVRTARYNYGKENVKWAMNITDIEDKIIRDSKLKFPDVDPKDAVKKLTSEYEKYFWDDVGKLNIESPDVVPHAADEKYVRKMRELTKVIFEKGFGYIKDGSVYFNVLEYSKKYKYGQLLNLDLSSLKADTRIDSDEYEKENIQDFVLWKGRKEGEPFWDFELNGQSLPGRPGWHIECSAMGGKDLGIPFDIHTGGEDLKFPHHEDEIAQSVIAYGIDKPVNYWLHNGMLMVEGKKMSKSLGNFYDLRDIEKRGFKPLAFRFLTLQTHYKKPLDFSWGSLEAAENGLKHLKNQVYELMLKTSSPLSSEFDNIVTQDEKVNIGFKNKFSEAINDDLNMPQALAVVQELLKSNLKPEEILATFFDFDRVLGLNMNYRIKFSKLPLEIEELRVLRLTARDSKNWVESDRLRKEIESKGYVVEDIKDGMRVRKK